MQFKIIGGKTFQILHTFEAIGGGKRYIVGYDGVICYLNEERYVILTLEELSEEVEVKSKAKWRSQENKKLYLEYYLSVLNMMKSFTRNQKIDNILNKNEFDPIILAC